jgi:DNA topoisomerase-1
MVLKKSRFGPFLGCSGYPECKNTRRLDKQGKPVPPPKATGVTCPKCRQGELLERRGKFGRPFFGCSRYPKCDYLVNSLEEVANYTPENNAPMEAKDIHRQKAGKNNCIRERNVERGRLKKKDLFRGGELRSPV